MVIRGVSPLPYVSLMHDRTPPRQPQLLAASGPLKGLLLAIFIFALPVTAWAEIAVEARATTALDAPATSMERAIEAPNGNIAAPHGDIGAPRGDIDAPSMNAEASSLADAPAPPPGEGASPTLIVPGDDASSSDARRRAQRAVLQADAHEEYHPSDTRRDVDTGRIGRRLDAVPRDLPETPRVGCDGLPKPPTPTNGCGGCAACSPPTGEGLDERSTALQILAATLLLAVIGGLLFRILARRSKWDAPLNEENALLTEARALDDDAIEAALSRGDRNAAIHAIYLRALLHLRETGVVIARDWTPREIAQRARVVTQATAPLRALTSVAELARFADHRSTDEELHTAQASARALEQALAPHAPTSKKGGVRG